jgi:hypothetical protein
LLRERLPSSTHATIVGDARLWIHSRYAEYVRPWGPSPGAADAECSCALRITKRARIMSPAMREADSGRLERHGLVRLVAVAEHGALVALEHLGARRRSSPNGCRRSRTSKRRAW